MHTALEIALIVVLTAIAAGLVPLLFQLRRTAQDLDLFLLSWRKDSSRSAGTINGSLHPRPICARERLRPNGSRAGKEDRLVSHSN